MRCCVQGCQNDSRDPLRCKKITFHAFPAVKKYRAAWLRALGKSQRQVKDSEKICSEHFDEKDLYLTKTGLRKVKAGAVPTCSLNGISDENNIRPQLLKICRLCLQIKCNLHSIQKYKLESVFENLTGIIINLKDGMPYKLCSMCAYKLQKYDLFRKSCVESQNIMKDALKRDVTQILESIKHKENELQITTKIDVYDLIITEFDEEQTNIEDDGTENIIEYDETENIIENDETENIIEEDETDNIIEDDETDNIIEDDETENIIEDDETENIIKDDETENNIEDDETENITEDDETENIIKDDETENNIEDDETENITEDDETENIIEDDETENNIEDDETENIIEDNEIENIDENFNYDDYLIFLTKNDTIENEKHNQDNFESENNYNFDSDDSIPLEQIHERKKSEKTKKVKKTKEILPKVDTPIMKLNETLFTITKLTFEEQRAEIEKRKMTANYKYSVFKCEICYKGFSNQEAYNGHLVKHTNVFGEHECNVCKTHYKNTKTLRKHISSQHIHRYSCKQCSLVTTHRHTARLHERWHNGTQYSCPHCNKVFFKASSYLGHLRIQHPSHFACELCGYSFVSARGIELHKKFTHRNDDGVIPSDGPYCQQCNLRFASNEAYRRHLTISPKHVSKEDVGKGLHNKRKFTRAVIDREKFLEMYAGDENNKYRGRIKRPEGPIPCEQCGIQLSDSRAYHAHFRRMHPDKNRTKYPSMKTPCMCELCGKIFQSPSLLKDHRWVHTDERPYKCEQCGKSFRVKQCFVSHRRVHAADKASYGCVVCGKQFTTPANRQRHMFIHTGLKPFKCEFCGKDFKYSCEKRAHIKYVHLKKPWPKRNRTKRNG